MENLIHFIYIFISIVATTIGLVYIISYINFAANADIKSDRKESAFLSARAESRKYIAFSSICSGVAMLIAGGQYLEWGKGIESLIVVAISTTLIILSFKFSPKDPQKSKIYYEDEFKRSVNQELQKLLGRVGALQQRASASDDVYRSSDALSELEEYLKQRIAK